MGRNLLSEFMYHLDADGGMKLGHAPKHVQEWLKDLGLPWNIMCFLQSDWPQAESLVGGIWLSSSVEMMENEKIKALLPHKFLHLGAALNGDYLVLDFSREPCPPGYISHEEYCEHEDNPRVIFQPVARSLESLLYRIVEGRYVPRDYFAARDYNELLEEEKKFDHRK